MYRYPFLAHLDQIPICHYFASDLFVSVCLLFSFQHSSHKLMVKLKPKWQKCYLVGPNLLYDFRFNQKFKIAAREIVEISKKYLQTPHVCWNCYMVGVFFIWSSKKLVWCWENQDDDWKHILKLFFLKLPWNHTIILSKFCRGLWC